MQKSCITVISDFGYADIRTAAMIGAILKEDEDLYVYPISSAVRKDSVNQASGMLYSVIPYWPEGTIFISSVGKSEGHKPCVAVLKNGCCIVTPDNGTLTMPEKEFGVEAVYEIDPENFSRDDDLLAQCAARLASGRMRACDAGAEYCVSDIVRCGQTDSFVTHGRAEGEIMIVLENFGNLTLSIGIDEFEKTGIRSGDLTHITLTYKDDVLFSQNVLFHRSFGYVRKSEPILFNGSSGYIGLGLNMDSFAAKYLPDLFAKGVKFSDYKVVIEKI